MLTIDKKNKIISLEMEFDPQKYPLHLIAYEDEKELDKNIQLLKEKDKQIQVLGLLLLACNNTDNENNDFGSRSAHDLWRFINYYKFDITLPKLLNILYYLRARQIIYGGFCTECEKLVYHLSSYLKDVINQIFVEEWNYQIYKEKYKLNEHGTSWDSEEPLGYEENWKSLDENSIVDYTIEITYLNEPINEYYGNYKEDGWDDD